MDDQAATPQRTFADVWQRAAALVEANGEALGAFLGRLEGRAHGALALILGLLLLAPVKWLLPQITGLLLLASGWVLFGGSGAPFLPFLGGRTISKQRLESLGVSIQSQTWLDAISQPRLDGFAKGFAQHAEAIAFILAGLAAMVPSTHFVLGLGLIVLGLGMLQRDGAASLAGMATTFAASAFTLTLVAGAAAGAPFAAAWGQENLPFISVHDQPAP
jgi:hypothetical protein